MAAVAEKAGIAKGTTYLYFKSKDDLLAGLQARHWTTVLQASATALERADRPRLDRLVEVVAIQLDIHRRHEPLLHLIFHEIRMDDHSFLQEITKVLERFIIDGVRDRSFVVTEPQTTATFLVSGLHGLIVDYIHSARPNRKQFLATTRILLERTLIG